MNTPPGPVASLFILAGARWAAITTAVPRPLTGNSAVATVCPAVAALGGHSEILTNVGPFTYCGVGHRGN